MENVKGILSSRVEGKPIFDRIHSDLQKPNHALGMKSHSHEQDHQYHLFSLVKKRQFDLFGPPWFDPDEFVIECEKYGIPQTRHRVILLGIRDDLKMMIPPTVLQEQHPVPAGRVLRGLPRLRSGLSRDGDSAVLWQELMKASSNDNWIREVRQANGSNLVAVIESSIRKITKSKADRGGEFIPGTSACDYMRDEWFLDGRLQGTCNHSTRAHTVGRLETWECRNGFCDTSGYGGGKQETWFNSFPSIEAEQPPKRLADGRLDAAYCYWFFLKISEPVLCIDTSGRLYKLNGDVHHLVSSYAEHKRIWPLITETALDLLP